MASSYKNMDRILADKTISKRKYITYSHFAIFEKVQNTYHVFLKIL